MSHQILQAPILFLTLFWLYLFTWFQTYLIVSSICCSPIFIQYLWLACISIRLTGSMQSIFVKLKFKTWKTTSREKNIYQSKEDKSKAIYTHSDIVQVKTFVYFIPCNQNLQITCYFEKDFYVSKINKTKKFSRK